MWASDKHQDLGVVERLVRKDRTVVLIGVVCLTVAACLYTFFGVGFDGTALRMTQMAHPIGEPMQMGLPAQWSLQLAVLVFLMWWIMMIAMMAPSVAPALLTFTAIQRIGPDAARAPLLGGFFMVGYLLVWAVFSAAATLWQWGLESAQLLNGGTMSMQSRACAGLFLIAAGLYQFSTLKTMCLRLCRSPGKYLDNQLERGLLGAVRAGARHGAYCLGCCWALMTLLFVGGVMNLYWIAGLALYVGAEKLLVRASRLPVFAAWVLIAAGAYFLVDGLLARTA